MKSYIAEKFLEQSIKVNPDWLDGCISWFVAEDPGISRDNLYKRTYDQWLLGDVAEVSLPCLPDTLTDLRRNEGFEFTGKMVLQLNFILDISESPYDQLRALHNKVLDATDEEKIEARQFTKKHRMLKLELTDGLNKITAMEHKPISVISTKLVPGCKILILGPIKVVNRVLFLTPPNIKLLGGELDSLLITNAYENTLLRLLNMPTKTNPITNYTEAAVIESRPGTQLGNTNNNNRSSRPANFAKPTEHDPFGDAMDEDLLDMAMAQVEQKEMHSQPPPPPSANSAPHQSTIVQKLLPQFNDFIDSSMLLNDDFDMDAIQAAMQQEEELHPEVAEIFTPGYLFKFDNCYLATIEQIQSKEIEVLLGKTMIVKAKFLAVVEKLRFVGGSASQEATMSILVQDSWSNGKLRVQIASSVMDTLLIYDTKELKEMFKNIQKQPQVRDEIQVALDDLKTKVQTLDSFIRVNYTLDDGFILSEIIKPDPALNAKFASKIKEERLTVVKR